MPGTSVDPIRLDPYRRLLEIHFDSIKYAAFAVDMNGGPWTGDISPAWSGEPVISAGTEADKENYLLSIYTTTSRYGYVGWSPATSAEYLWSESRGWFLPPDTLYVPLPAFGEFNSYGAWVAGDIDGQWSDFGSGDGQGMSVPFSNPEIPFTGGTSPTFRMTILRKGTGALPLWYEFYYGPFDYRQFQGVPLAGTNVLDFEESYNIGAGILSFSNNGGTTLYFQPIATASAPVEGRLWVLCARI